MTQSLHTLIQYLRHRVADRGEVALSDAQLLERWIGQQDPAAFELILWRHGPMVLNTCRRLLPRREDIEDAFQATFLVLVRKAGTIRRREALAAWLHRVAYRIANRAAVIHRANREQPIADTPAAPYIDSPAERELSAILDEEIDSLPAHYRRALILCCLEGKSQEEAGRLLNCPRGTVSSWLTRGRERLRKRLLRRGIVVSSAGLTAALTPDALASGGMISLVGSLVRMAGAVAAGGTLSSGLMSARTIALTEGVLRMMFMTKVKIVAAISLVVAIAATGVGTWSRTIRAADDPIVLIEKSPKETLIVAKHTRNEAPIALKSTHEIDSIAWGEKVHGLQAGIAFRRGDQETYEIGQSVTFVVYLRNVSDKKINLSHIEPMFDEWMPVVVDANGRRLAVAHGSINLGEVPITHRSVEAGQRITLGYPWFRIRRLDWRGEVQGPTCCVESGTYKVGFTHLALRLDNGKDISLGTKQVELIIRKREIAKEDRANGQAPIVDQQLIRTASNAEEAGVFFISARSLQIPIRIDPKHREKLRELILLVSKDRGQTWEMVDKKPLTEQRFLFRAKEDGMYWFIVQRVDDEGRTEPPDPSRVKPTLRVCVDTTAPLAELFRPEINQKTVDLRWMAQDANLAENPITLEWAKQKNGPWRRISEDNLPNTGSYKWHLPKEMPSAVYLRIRVRDKAGNEACAATDKPISRAPKQSSKLEALLREEEAASLMSAKHREEIAFRVADCYLNLGQYEKAIPKYEEIAKLCDGKPAGLRALAGTIRCLGAMGDLERCKQQTKAIRDRLHKVKELTEAERQRWLVWLDTIDNGR